MAHGDPLLTPYSYDSGEDANGKHVSITINFDNATRVISGGTLHRDPGCLYKHILIGLGPDGKPDDTTHSFNISNVNGDQVVGAAAFTAVGLTTIESVLALGQITAGF